MVKHRIQCLDAWHFDVRFLCELDRRPEVRLHLHGSSSLEVLPHYAVCHGLPRHVVHGLLLEIGVEFAAMGGSQLEELVNDTRDEWFYSRFG